MTRFKGDDTNAFGNTFITINLNNPYNYEVSKAIFVCGCFQKVFEKPQFPLRIGFTSEETKKMQFKNVCYLVVFDSEGRQKTCERSLTFALKEAVYNG